MTSLDEYYRILELEPGASLEEIHQGYRDLAMVWHPDRFLNHPRLQQKAHKKFQQINEAHQQLRCCKHTAIPVTSPINSDSKNAPSSHPQTDSNKFYRKPSNKAKAESKKQTNCDYIPFNNLNRKDVFMWLD